MATQETQLAAERHCDLMRQGFMRGSPVPPASAAQVKAGKEYAARVIAKLEAIEVEQAARQASPLYANLRAQVSA